MIVGAAVVVVGAADEALDELVDVVVVLDDPTLIADGEDVELSGATVLLDAAPGISLATRPPSTAAVRAAPPVATPVMRLTLRRADDRCSAWSRGGIDSSSGRFVGVFCLVMDLDRAYLAMDGPPAGCPL